MSFPRPLSSSTRTRAVALGAAVLAGAGAFSGATGGQFASATAATTTVIPVIPGTPYRPAVGFYGSNSEWTRPVTSAPLDPNSANLVANLASQVSTRYSGVAAFNDWNYNVGFVESTPLTPRNKVIFDNCQGKQYVPSQLYTVAGGAHFADVPIPDDAIPAAGSDGELSVWSPATDQLWEFWMARKAADGWHACWGGRIDSFSTSPGYFANGMGVTATGLSATAGSIGIREMQAGRIDHALSLNVVDAANGTLFAYPAQRSDGNQPVGTPNAIVEGQRFRLDPTLDVNSLNLSPIAAAVARAAQKYGFIVNDRGGAVAVIAESGAGAAKLTGVDPWTALRAGTPGYNVMKGFPWSRLQALSPVGPAQPAALVERKALTVSIKSGPPSLTAVSTASFEIASSDLDAALSCSIDGGPFQGCNARHTYTGLRDGAHTLSVKANDAWGKSSATATWAWTVDTTAPAAARITFVHQQASDSQITLFFSALDGTTTFDCRLDQRSWAPCGPKYAYYVRVAPGPHVVEVRTRDAAGNVGVSAKHAWQQK